jgi:hypothetical protein
MASLTASPSLAAAVEMARPLAAARLLRAPRRSCARQAHRAAAFLANTPGAASKEASEAAPPAPAAAAAAETRATAAALPRPPRIPIADTICMEGAWTRVGWDRGGWIGKGEQKSR